LTQSNNVAGGTNLIIGIAGYSFSQTFYLAASPQFGRYSAFTLGFGIIPTL
jgi:hypothetical protein